MPEAKRLSVRVDTHLLRRIDAARGETSISTWFRETCARRLEAEVGLGPEFRDDLLAYSAQIRGIAINLNQLARAANENRPVVVNDKMLADLRRELSASRELLVQVRAALLE